MSEQADPTEFDVTTPDCEPTEKHETRGYSAVAVVMAGIALTIGYAIGTSGWRWDQAMAGFERDYSGVIFRWFIRSTIAEILVIWWVVAVTGTIGSFLNVIVYRMPRGLSLSRSGSRCVHCQTPIHWYDNQPILGWFLLRGRCRACRGAISGRYPLVEFMAVALGVTLFFVVVQTALVGPPAVRMMEVYRPTWFCFWLLNPIPVQRLVMFFYLLSTLMATLAIAWASFDGVRLPRKFYVATIGLVVGSSLLYQAGAGGWLAQQFERPEWSDVQFLAPSVQDGIMHYLASGLRDRWQVELPTWSAQLIGQAGGWIFGAAIGSLLALILGKFFHESNQGVVRQATAIYGLLGLVGGWYLPLAVSLLWTVEVAVRFLVWLSGSECSSRWQNAIWFGLPFYLLIATVAWRWFP
jgi:prepilin signal peptidase PulO-like enzyme (type II secretory pathway)